MAHQISTISPAVTSANDMHSTQFFKAGLKEVQLDRQKGSNKSVELNAGRNASYTRDANQNVVLRITDENGRIVMQIPSEEHLIMAKMLKEESSKILLKKA